MSQNVTQDSSHEELLNVILLEYLEQIEAGQVPDVQRLIAEHPELRSDIEEFIANHGAIHRAAAPLREPQTRLTNSSLGSLAAQAHSEADGPGIGQLGDFQILREVGRGGMGVVYEAQQISLRRRVALKVLPFASAIDSRQLQRFKNEALAAAHLQHANIVPVHAVGCERGVHYYAMQFIDGLSLSEYIANLRQSGRLSENSTESTETELQDAGSGVSQSVTRTRPGRTTSHHAWVARLGRQAAQALEYAHQMGVVHRDVKPSNLLLDHQGQVWVTDFGLAQIGGDGNLTATGEILGTLRYSSPEQALAKRAIVDHRSDIYSLGATLYELLTLQPVFDGRDRHELLRQIANDEPRLPRSIDPTIPEDLETVLLKALRKDSAERYATADDFANDLQRVLDHRPILARRPTFFERVRKWGRRHPTVIASGFLVLTLLTLISLFSAAMIRLEQGRTRTAQKNAEEAYEREKLRAEEAEQQYRLARRSVDEILQVSEEELAHRQGMEGLRKRLLMSVLDYYQEFSRQKRDDPQARAELADTTHRVEGILADLAVLRSASRMYLLGQSDVLDDLKITGDQRIEVQELATRMGREWFSSFHQIRSLSPAERGQRTLVRARAVDAELNAFLTPVQEKRLYQIALQVEGTAAFRDHEVLTALQLTPIQRDQIRRLEEDLRFERMRAGQNWGPREGTTEQTGSSLQAQLDRVMYLLTNEQKQKWRSLVGAPFTGQIQSFVPFGRPAAPPRR